MTAASNVHVQLVVLAKCPRPGRVKTRLSSAYTPRQAAELAAAALRDTLDAVAATRCVGRVLALDTTPGGWLPAGFTFVRQRGGGLAERLRNALADAYARRPRPVLLVGMDTPQLDAGMLTSAGRTLLSGPHDAVLGPATDGGFWVIGMGSPHPGAFSGVPMSVPTTYREQLRQLTRLRLRVGILPPLTDVDDPATAEAVAGSRPDSRFAACHRLDPAGGMRSLPFLASSRNLSESWRTLRAGQHRAGRMRGGRNRCPASSASAPRCSSCSSSAGWWVVSASRRSGPAVCWLPSVCSR